MRKTVVVNKNYQPYDVYIGRGSKWGNPFIIGKDGSREDVVEKFRAYFAELRRGTKITDRDIADLLGLRLGCFCKPRPCHGDVIVEELEKIIEKRKADATTTAPARF
jgi:hypothetical protein